MSMRSSTVPRRAARCLDLEMLEDRCLLSGMPLVGIVPPAVAAPAPPALTQSLPALVAPTMPVVQSVATTIGSAAAAVTPLLSSAMTAVVAPIVSVAAPAVTQNLQSALAPVEPILQPVSQLVAPVSQAVNSIVGAASAPIADLLGPASQTVTSLVAAGPVSIANLIRPTEIAVAQLSQPVIGTLAPAASEIAEAAAAVSSGLHSPAVASTLRHVIEVVPSNHDSALPGVPQGAPTVTGQEAQRDIPTVPLNRDEAEFLLSFLITGIVPGGTERPAGQDGAVVAPVAGAAAVSYEGSDGVLPLETATPSLSPQAAGALADASPFGGVALETAWANFLDQVAVARYESFSNWAGLSLALWLVGAGVVFAALQQQRRSAAKAGLLAAINEDDATLAWSLGLGQACAAE